jgi:hypothetical protein
MSIIEGESHLLHKERQHSTSHNDSADSNGMTVGKISLASHGVSFPFVETIRETSKNFYRNG